MKIENDTKKTTFCIECENEIHKPETGNSHHDYFCKALPIVGNERNFVTKNPNTDLCELYQRCFYANKGKCLLFKKRQDSCTDT